MDTVQTVQLIVRIVLAVVFVAMGVLHFVPAVGRGMAAAIPPGFRGRGWPSPKTLVRFTGVCEILGGVGLLVPVPAFRLVVGVLLILFLIAVFPANAYMAASPERFGPAAVPLVPRLIGQVVLAAIVLFAAWPLGG